MCDFAGTKHRPSEYIVVKNISVGAILSFCSVAVPPYFPAGAGLIFDQARIERDAEGSTR